MTRELFLRRKWTLRAQGEKVVFVKRANERREHVLMKAFVWALYLPRYPDLLIEVHVNDRYKPDLVSLDIHGSPRFWGEAGHVSPSKVLALLRRYRYTHFAIAKWGTTLDPLAELVRQGVTQYGRRAPFDLLRFPVDSAERFLSRGGEIALTHADIEWLRLP